ncbi:MAG: divalent-cation tolerance protein CutA [Ignavibacteriae bacterium HGW-Ignavibacteriae-4]|jgi:periplasmic divalent cation tolerance protein|nr:MAG: divalent-cation tolerance protein CutA [Ignavibacteriae bacterium HGW-Ignavibacteriae-4]
MIKTENFIILICNTPNIDNAKQIAHKLVKEKLAACVNLFSGVTSIYEWEGAIEEETEITMIIKTLREYREQTEEMILEIHPFDTPEIIQIDVPASNGKYYDWLVGALKN